MYANKSALLKGLNRLALFLVTGALLVTGITPAQANVTTPLFLSFETADVLKTVSSTPSTGPYGGATTEIKASTNLSGNSLHFTKSTGSTVWAGVNLLLANSTPFRYTDASKPIITLDYWSNDTVPSPVMMKVEGAGAALKTVTAQPGLNRLSFDMSTGTGWNPDAVYKIIAFFPNFGADDRTYTGPGPVANTGQVYEIDNVSINGGTSSDLYVPVAAGRDVPATLVTFEANDALGAKVVGDSTGAKPEGSFAGAATTIVDAPAGGNGGKALKIVKAGEVYSGATILNITGNTRITNGTHKTVTFNYFSAKANSPLRVELVPYPRALGKTVTVPAGWSRVVVDFSDVAGWSATEDYLSLAIFPDFNVAPGAEALSYFVDDIAINGAVTPAIRNTPQVLVNFESNDTSGYSLTDFSGNQSSVVTDAPADGSVGSTKALKLAFASGDPWAGTTFLSRPAGESLISAGNFVVKANIYSPVAGKRLNLKLENVATPSQAIEKEANSTSVVGWKTYTFDFTVGGSLAIDYNRATFFADFLGSPKSTSPFFIDDIAFNGAKGADLAGGVVVEPPFTGNANVRLVGMDDTNSFNRPADAAFWSVANPWYRVGVNARTKQVPVGSTQELTYLVTNAADNTPLANQTVTFVMGKQYSGSNAKVNVGNVASVGEQNKTVTGVTNAQGRVTFSMVNTDVAADAANNPGTNLGADFTGKKLFTQATAWVTSQTQDSIDMVDFVFFKPADAPVVFTGNANVRLVGMDDTNSFNRPADAAFWSVANPWYRVGVNARTKQVPVGSTQELTYLVTNAADNTPLANQTVTFVMGKQYSGSNAKVNVGNVASVGEQNKTVTGVTNAQGRVTFSMVNTDVAADAANNPGTNLGADFTGKKLFTQATAWVTSQTQDSIDMVDFIFFKPADAPVTKTVVSRVVGADATNAWISEGEGWYQYYAAGIRYIQRGIEVGKTTSLSFAVTADGAPYANKTVKLLLGKTYSGSSAKVAVNGTAFPGVGDEKVIELTTNASGLVSFDVSNSNFSADADPYQAANLKNPEGSKKLFVQIAVVGEKGNQDILDIIDLFYYKAQAAAPATTYNARLADWDASNSFDGTKVWGDAGLGDWFDVHTGYFAHYVKAGSTFNLRYKVTNAATGVNAPDGTVVTVTLGAAWSSSNAKFTSGSTVIDGKTKWGGNGQLDQGSVTATVVNGIATVSLTSNDVAEDATINPGSATANPDTLSPLFMQAKIKVEGNAITRQDWVNIVVTQAPSAPTISAVSSTTGKRGQAIDIVGTNLGDALGQSVILYTAATTKVAAISTPVTVLSVNPAGTRMTVRSPSATQKGTFRVTNSAGTASAPAAFTASSTATSKPTITMTASVVKEVGSEITLTGTNLASSTSITIGSVNAPFRIVTATTVVLTVPAGVVSGSKISATNAGGVTTTSKYVYQAAVVATTTAAAKVGQTVTITGSNLKATSVVFGGNKSAKPVINDGDTLTVVVPTGALTGLIKITTGAGVVYTKSFTVTPPTPTVTSFTPTTGKKGVTVVSVKGTNLTGATVTIGSTPVTVSAGASSTSLKFVIPAGATSGKITVTTGGGSATSASTLTIN